MQKNTVTAGAGNDSTGSDAFREAVAREIDNQQARSQRGVQRWNVYYYGSLFGSIVFAAMAALLPKLDSVPDGFVRRDLPSILAALAALLTTLMHAGSFERRWRASRERRVRTQELRLELLDPSVDARNVLKRIQLVVAVYYQRVLAETDGAPPSKPDRDGAAV